MEELGEYVADKDQYLSEFAVKGLGKILQQFPNVS